MQTLLNKTTNWDQQTLTKTINDNSIDLIITDPPYEFINKNPVWWWFMDEKNKTHLKQLNKSFWMSFNPKNFLKESKRILKKMNMFVFTNNNLVYEYLDFANQNNYRYNIHVMRKTNPVPTFKWKFLDDLEYIIHIFESWRPFNSDQGYKNYFRDNQITTHQIAKGNKLYSHPTTKPEWIFEKYIKICSKEWDLVFDPFMWSWTTWVCAKKNWRNFIWFEINEKFTKTANERIRWLELLDPLEF